VPRAADLEQDHTRRSLSFVVAQVPHSREKIARAIATKPKDCLPLQSSLTTATSARNYIERYMAKTD
jgi:hypothetical protein